MSSHPPLPPDEGPTQRLAVPRSPREPEYAEAPYRGDPVGGPLPAATLLDQIRTLRNGVVVLALVSVAALLVALYAVSEARDADGGSGASSERVSDLEDRVSRLVTLVKDTRDDVGSADAATQQPAPGTAEASDVESLRSSVEALDAKVSGLEGQGGGDSAQAVADLGGRVDELAAQVKALQDQPQTTP